eukprot:gene23971-29541_t
MMMESLSDALTSEMEEGDASPFKTYPRQVLVELCLLRRVAQLCGEHVVLPAGVRHMIHSYCRERITQENIRAAVSAWQSNRAEALVRYGHISDWDVRQVTNVVRLFGRCQTFDDDIGGWDV